MTHNRHLYVPFQIAEGREIKEPLPFIGEIAGCSAELKRNEPYYVIELSRLSSEEEAVEKFRKTIVALYWLALDTQIGLLVQPKLQEVSYTTNSVDAGEKVFGPEADRKVDAIVHGDQSAIWEEGKQVVKVTGQPVRLVMSYSPSRLFEILTEGMSVPNPNAVLENSKLKLAIDLYCLSHFRSSDFARFLVLWTALETAAPEPFLSKSIIELIDKWIKEARDAQQQSTVGTGGDERQQLESIIGSLIYTKTKSHGIRTRQYVKKVLESIGDPDAEKLAREANELYRIRGNLSHTGKYDQLGDGLSRMDTIVCKTLKAAMLSA